jgi:hypothetical protein
MMSRLNGGEPPLQVTWMMSHVAAPVSLKANVKALVELGRKERAKRTRAK